LDDIDIGRSKPVTSNFFKVVGFKKVNAFVLKQKPELVGAKIVNVSTSYSGGKTYNIIYDSKFQ
jgi:hypothetical protein